MTARDAMSGAAGAGLAPVDEWADRTGPDQQRAERNAWLRAVVAQVICVAAIVGTNATALVADRFHWWANFILVPGAVLAALGIGLGSGPALGRYVLAWLGLVVFGTGVLLLVGAVGALWPIMIIMPCLGPVGLFLLRPADSSIRALVHTIAGLSTLGAVLGGWFLAMRADLVEPGRDRWWVWFMLAAATVPGVNGLVLLQRRRGPYWFSVAVLLLALAAFTVVAALREHGR